MPTIWRRGDVCARHILLLSFALVLPAAAPAAVIVNAPTTSWLGVSLESGQPLDYFVDQQTGSPEADIAGTVITTGFFIWYDDDGSAAPNAGTMGFRVRLGADLPQPGQFNSAVFVGIDANGDGALDLFVGADNRGSTDLLKIWNAGSGANLSPSTTSVSSPAGQKTYTLTSANYHFAPVSATIDPLTSSYDLNGDGNTDFLLSFTIPFADIVSEASRLRGMTITRDTPLRYVIMTSQQDNAFNQDLGGVQGGVNSASTWSQLGAVSTPMTPEGSAVPEPDGKLTGIAGLAAILAGVWRRRPR
jgi:hypothetical protein